MNRGQALDTVRMIMNEYRAPELVRLDRIKAALSCRTPSVILPTNPDPVQALLAEKAQTNLLPLVERAFSQGLELVGCSTPGVEGNVPGWRAWSRNGFDARQQGVHTAALRYGTAYVRVLPGDTGVPALKGRSPRQVTALYRDADDEWPMLALEVDGPDVTLWDETRFYRFGIESGPFAGLLGPRPGTVPLAQYVGTLDYIDDGEHGVTADGGTPVAPFVRYRDSMELAGEEQLGIIEPLIVVQERIDETSFGQLVAQYVAAFAQQYVAGWVPASDAEALKAKVSNLWTFKDADTKVGQLDGTDPERYLTAQRANVRMLAAISQLPAQGFGDSDVTNVSAETLTMLQYGKDQRTGGFQASLGESHEQLLRIAAENTTGLEGDELAAAQAAAVDYDTQVRWADKSARSLAQVADALSKMADSLKIPPAALWELIPGVTDATLERWRALADAMPAEGDPLAAFTAMLDEQAAGADPAAFTAADAAAVGGTGAAASVPPVPPRTPPAG